MANFILHCGILYLMFVPKKNLKSVKGGSGPKISKNMLSR